jgi:hypothetical protein
MASFVEKVMVSSEYQMRKRVTREAYIDYLHESTEETKGLVFLSL